MILTAHILLEDTTPWLYITAPPIAAGGERLCIFDAPLNLTSKHTIKLEIDHAHEQTGIPRPDLYDAFRAFQAQQRRAA
jgi:hypothetical protein